MAHVTNSLLASLLLFIILMDSSVLGRICHPECDIGERCIFSRPRNLCVPLRCLTQTRTGRCRHSIVFYQFISTTLRCQPIPYNTCYSFGNRFESQEECELTCIPWYLR